MSSIEARLKELLPASPLYEPARYALFSGGKRLRPTFVLASATTFEGDLSAAIDPACAIEMIHTYSLIHDDLPCMDNDDLRRGKPTLHKAFPEGIALLTGDYFLTFAFELITQAPELDETQKLRLIATLSSAAGISGMVGGQAMDLESSGAEKNLEQMYQGKTGALFAASLQFGAIIARQFSYLPHLEVLGKEIGMAFQLLDDLSDIEKDGQKSTAIHLYGVDGVKAKLKQIQQSIDAQIQILPRGAPLIAELINSLYLRK